jgi:hypothetical protein
MKPNGHTLCSDHSQYDNSSGINDILCGNYLSALHQLSGNFRQLLEDSNLHVELVEFGGRNVVGKIVKRRESEFLTGQTRHFVFDNEGHRIPLEEEEFDKLLGLEGNPDDVYNTKDLVLESIDSETLPAFDAWDVVYDCTEYIRAVERLFEDEKWQAKPVVEKYTELTKLSNELIYSANWFQYPADKRIHGHKAKLIVKEIEKGITRAQLGALIGPRNPEKRIESAQKLRKRALSMPLGIERGKVLVKAQQLTLDVIRDQRKIRVTGKTYDPISDSDRANLWAKWREREVKVNGSVQLMSWQFSKMYYAKLDKQVIAGQMTAQERDQKHQDAMQRLYGTNKVIQAVQEKTMPVMPSWLVEAPSVETVREYDEWIPPTSIGIQNDTDDEEWLQNILLSGGE